MTLFVIKRLAQSILVIIIVSIIVFAGVYAIGNPADLLINPEVTQVERERIIHELGLDRPLLVQYFVFIKNALHGELGDSFIHNRPAIKLILERLPASLELSIFAMLFAIIFGIPLGVLVGLKSSTLYSKGIMAVSILSFSMPTFWSGILMIMIFGMKLHLLPTTGRGDIIKILGLNISFLTFDGIKHLIMPAINLGLYPFGLLIRLTASGVKETLLLDFVNFAMAKGLKKLRIIYIHIMKNILIPIVTTIGVQFSLIFAFSVLTESIFGWPGMGKLLLDSIVMLDRPVIIAYLLVITIIFIIINMIVDMIYSVLDPRIKLRSL